MTHDLLSALRETPGCGQDPDCTWPHDRAVEQANECDPCLTRLAEAVLNHYGPRIMELARDAVVINYRDWPSLLSALRSETPR